MAQKKGYSRYFIILQEEEKGFSLSNDKLPSGYVKLELKNEKCKVSYYVQNLKKGSSPYYMVLICNKKEIKKIIKLGEMEIDEHGRTDISFEYPYDNIADTSVPMDKVSGAAVIKILDENIISVMSGFSSTEIPDWKTYELLRTEIKKEMPEEPEKNIFDQYEENIQSTDNLGNLALEDGGMFRSFIKNYSPFDNISDEIKRCVWYRVPAEEIVQSEELYYPVMNLHNDIMENGYILLGGKYAEDGNLKYIIYGIPGRNQKDYQPLNGQSGFVTWIPEKQGDEGYWLMFYDNTTSTIVVPFK